MTLKVDLYFVFSDGTLSCKRRFVNILQNKKQDGF